MSLPDWINCECFSVPHKWNFLIPRLGQSTTSIHCIFLSLGYLGFQEPQHNMVIKQKLIPVTGAVPKGAPFSVYWIRVDLVPTSSHRGKCCMPRNDWGGGQSLHGSWSDFSLWLTLHVNLQHWSPGSRQRQRLHRCRIDGNFIQNNAASRNHVLRMCLMSLDHWRAGWVRRFDTILDWLYGQHLDSFGCNNLVECTQQIGHTWLTRQV